MRRGFKAWCETTAGNYRQALGVSPTAALDPKRLAAHLGIRVTTPEGIPTLSETSRRQLLEVDPDSWSAVTLVRNDSGLVILNSAHGAARQRSSLAHELAHILLNHASDQTHLSALGLLFRRSFDREQEREADWLAGCLLVPRDGLLKARLRTPSEDALATRFGVSVAMISWRLRVTGVLRQVGRFPGRHAARRAGRAASVDGDVLVGRSDGSDPVRQDGR